MYYTSGTVTTIMQLEALPPMSCTCKLSHTILLISSLQRGRKPGTIQTLTGPVIQVELQLIETPQGQQWRGGCLISTSNQISCHIRNQQMIHSLLLDQVAKATLRYIILLALHLCISLLSKIYTHTLCECHCSMEVTIPQCVRRTSWEMGI